MGGTAGRPLRVAFYGEFGTGNLGNDASLAAAMAAVRSHVPDAEVVCLCNAPDSVTRRFRVHALAIRDHLLKGRPRSRRSVSRVIRRVTVVVRLCTTDLFRMYRIMKRFDAVIVPGMGVMEAGWMKPGSFAAPLLMTTVAAYLAGVSVAFVSIGAGVAHRRSTRALFRWALRLATYRSFRDDYSRRSAAGFGAPCGADAVYPDLVFGLRATQHSRPSRSEVPTVGVGLIKYRAAFSDDEPARRDAIAARYLESMTSVVGWLLHRGCRVVLLTGDRKDEEEAESIYKAVATGEPARSLEIARSDSFDDLLDHLRRLDFMIGSRYHNIIAATLAARPVVSVSYMRKNAELLNHMHLETFHQPLEDLDAGRLCQQLLDLQGAADRVSRQLVVKGQEYRERVEQQWSRLAETILSTRRSRRFARAGTGRAVR